MGFDEGRIILDRDNGAYYAGQTVYGRIVFDQGKPKTIHGIYVSCKGFCKVHWTTTESRRVNGETRHETIVHESYEEYFNRKTFIFGSENGEHHLQSGHHEFNFNCPIPNNCPSTYEGAYGHIRYRVKVVMVTSGIFSSNKEKKAAIRVHAPLDLNADPYCRDPIEFEMINSYCCWCMSAGSSAITVRLPVGGYCPGQVIPLEVSVTNHSTVEIQELKFAIKKDAKFEATSRPGIKHERDTVAEIKKGPIQGGTTRNWTLQMDVPVLDIYNVNACRFIDIDYFFKVSTETSGCHEDAEETHRIVFGTIPLVGFQDNVPNPLQDQLPKPIEVQNIQSGNFYPPPQNTPYPNGVPQNTPYPVVAPYPTSPNVTPFPTPGIQPYPNTSPYPNTTPYPNTASPYPNTASPYPPNSSPYPNTGSPFPPSNTPYPTSTPYSPGNPHPAPGYPGGMSPVPPYPGGNPPPYPGNDPGVTNSSLLKTGNFGFAVPSGVGSSAPLMPSTANVPYPTSPPVNPFMTASAPEPSTPGSDIKRPPEAAEVSSPYPPYNPDFVHVDKKDVKPN